MYIYLSFLLRMVEYGNGRMWVGKLGGTQAKLNKSALKRGRLRAMVKSWEDLQTVLGKKQERRKMILENMGIKYSGGCDVSPSSHFPYKF